MKADLGCDRRGNPDGGDEAHRNGGSEDRELRPVLEKMMMTRALGGNLGEGS